VSEQAGADGVTRIVEVGAKPETERVATAECWVTTTSEAVGHLVAGTKKGDPIQTAKIAGVIGVKQTPALLPHCHPIRVTGADVTVEPDEAAGRLRVDSAKAFDRAARIDGLRLLRKSGGKSGEYVAEG